MWKNTSWVFSLPLKNEVKEFVYIKHSILIPVGLGKQDFAFLVLLERV